MCINVVTGNPEANLMVLMTLMDVLVVISIRQQQATKLLFC